MGRASVINGSGDDGGEHNKQQANNTRTGQDRTGQAASRRDTAERTTTKYIVNNIIYFGAGATQLSKQTSTNTYINTG